MGGIPTRQDASHVAIPVIMTFTIKKTHSGLETLYVSKKQDQASHERLDANAAKSLNKIPTFPLS